jgi:molecular chaperone HtpG
MNAFDVDLPALLRLFGGHLYADPGVFARELVQNGVDAIVARRRGEPGHAGAVVVRTDGATIVFEDDGVGLAEDEIATSLGRIGHSTKPAADDELLGRFGVGLLSAFLVAERLTVDTRKAGCEAVRWTATPDGAWSVGPGNRASVGSTMTLEITPTQRSYATPERLGDLLRKYARWLPFDVRLGDERITDAPPWLAADVAGAVTAWLTQRGEAPLAVFPVTAGRTRGALWVRAGKDGGRVDVTTRGMLLCGGARDLLPKWATFVAGVVEAPDLSPTASRESFVDDEAATRLEETLRRALLEGLASLPADPDRFQRVVSAHPIQLRGACADAPDLLDAIGDHLPFETNAGLVELPALLWGRSERVLHYAETISGFGQAAPLANARGLALVNTAYVHDGDFLRAWAARRGVELRRITPDALGDLVRPVVDPRFADVLVAGREVLAPFDVVPELGRFEPGAMPALLLADPTMLAPRARQLARTTENPLVRSLLAGLSSARATPPVRLVLNADNPLIAALPSADPEGVGAVIRLLYVQSALVLRRTLTLPETRALSDDLLALLARAAASPGGWN